MYIRSTDSPLVLFNILDQWCLALGAKFNALKTVIILVKEHAITGKT